MGTEQSEGGRREDGLCGEWERARTQTLSGRNRELLQERMLELRTSFLGPL